LRAMAANSAWTLADDALRTASGDVLRNVRVALGLSGLDERALRRGMRLLADAGSGHPRSRPTSGSPRSFGASSRWRSILRRVRSRPNFAERPRLWSRQSPRV
jgi:hypothetical protein